jgi:hypothetical protein
MMRNGRHEDFRQHSIVDGMKLRFSIRSLFLATAGVAVCITGGKYLHDEVMIPRTRIAWRECTVEDIRREPEKRRILVVYSNATISSCSAVVCFDVDTPSTRTLAWKHSVECRQIESSEEVSTYLESRNVEPPWVGIVVTDGFRIASFRYTGERDGALARDIEEFFLGDGSPRQGETWRPHPIERLGNDEEGRKIAPPKQKSRRRSSW